MCRAAFFLAFVMFATRALGQESLDEIDHKTASEDPKAPEKPAKATAEVNGYIANRFSYSLIDPSTPVPTSDSPSLVELAEANIQLKVNLGAKTRFAYADISLFYQGGWLFYADNGSGGRKDVPDHDVSRPFVVPSELYVSWSPKPWFNLMVGKKRITWGSGFAFNPTDLINPRKDPTDPNLQRSGSWMVRLEAPFKKFTVSLLFAPQTLYSVSGIPYSMFKYPGYPPASGTDARDEKFHYLLAARLYLLLFSTDINLIYYFTSNYQNEGANKSRIGLSLSRYFFTDWEFHLDGIVMQGSPHTFPDRNCALNGVCDLATAVSPTKTNGAWYPRVLVGMRRQFADESLLSVEYYYQGDGDSDLEFEDTLKILARAKALLSSLGQATSANPQVSTGLPQRFSFDPLRRHYLIASFSKPRIRDDWTVTATLLVGLRDLSGLFSPSVTWTPREWLSLSLYAFVPIRGLGVGEAKVGTQSLSEYSLLPYNFQAMFELRAYY